MVRLKVSFTVNALTLTSIFQFQYGTIKSQAQTGIGKIDIEFQFQYGTIKRLTLNADETLVKVFQFQYGTIKS